MFGLRRELVEEALKYYAELTEEIDGQIDANRTADDPVLASLSDEELLREASRSGRAVVTALESSMADPPSSDLDWVFWLPWPNRAHRSIAMCRLSTLGVILPSPGETGTRRLRFRFRWRTCPICRSVLLAANHLSAVLR